ncbi:MAG: hypothetical protein L0Y72_30490 [Gemmataceae bacterium]|nr:hypothetical protein [Gemmataceae bacterium]
MLAKTCIPYSRNCLLPNSYSGDAAFWTKVGSQGVSLGNSMFLCSASGRLVERPDLRFLHIWLDNWRKFPYAERKPGSITIEERGEFKPTPRDPKPVPGGLFVKTFMRALDKNAQGELFAPAKLSLGISKTVVKAEPNRDFLWIKADEWKSLMPANPKKGDTFDVPDAIRTRIVRFHLVDGACCLPGFHERKQVHDATMSLTVEDVTPTSVQMRLSGQARVGAKTPHIEFDVAGTLAFDPGRQAFTRFDMVALSRSACHKDTASGRPLWLGIAFELGNPEQPADCRVPYRIWYDHYGLSDYFGR